MKRQFKLKKITQVQKEVQSPHKTNAKPTRKIYWKKKKNGPVHLKRVSYMICKIWFSEVIRKEKEMQIKTRLRYHILTYNIKKDFLKSVIITVQGH